MDGNVTIFPGGIKIGQAWTEDAHAVACRVVSIDPALHMIGFEHATGELEFDTTEHFLSTHHAASA